MVIHSLCICHKVYQDFPLDLKYIDCSCPYPDIPKRKGHIFVGFRIEKRRRRIRSNESLHLNDSVAYRFFSPLLRLTRSAPPADETSLSSVWDDINGFRLLWHGNIFVVVAVDVLESR